MRQDCPICGRSKSVMIKYEGTIKSEYCFGASCSYKKRDKKELTAELLEILKKQKKKQMDLSTLIDVRSSPEALKYMQNNRCAGSTANIYYNLKDQRVVFNYKDLYVGRCLDSTVSPKWYNYTNTDRPFVVQQDKKNKSKSVVLVEDCASACNASQVLDAIALLGTTLKSDYLDEVLQYEKIYIGLDEDATSKSFKIMDTLHLLRDCKIIILKKDLKYCSLIELERLFK
jgi:hypothetical protein